MREVAEDLFNKCLCLEEDRTHKNNNYNPSYASGVNTTTARNPSNAYNDQNQPPCFSQKPCANNNRYNRRSLRCPALTGEEREVLACHNGCFKCQLPYMPHITRDCPNNFPSPDNYEVCTDAWCQCRKPKPVASVHAIYDNARTSNHQPRASSSRVHITPVPETPLRVPVAVLPSVNFVLEKDNNDTDTPSPNGSGYRSNVSLFFVPHLKWKANFCSSSSNFLVAMDCLIDNACPYVLIHPDIVIDLGLTVRKVKKLFRTTSAFSNNEVSFDKYVTLQPSSVNNAWLSKLTRALLSNELCAPIILGLPFLQHNNLVIDHRLRIIIDKKCLFDLLDENSFKPPSKAMVTPHERRIKMHNYRKEFLIELK